MSNYTNTRHSVEEEEDDAASTETLIKKYEGTEPPFQCRRRRSGVWRVVALHATAIVLYGIVAALVTLHLKSQILRGQPLIFSPANRVVEYETRVYKASLRGDPEYFGPPSEQIDENWRQLMWPSTIHISEAERQHYDHNLPIVQFPDGTYSGQLMVYHELHCLKRLYHIINADYYFSNLTDHDREMERMHSEHCLGTLRQGIMCHSDVSVMPMVWGKNNPIPLGDFSSPHQCVNFDKLHKWAMGRAVTDGLEPGVLVHPTLGPSFPNGVGTKVGFGVADLDEDGNVITLGSE